jgi:hypothetical protein
LYLEIYFTFPTVYKKEMASVVWWLACWPLAPNIAGSLPTEAVEFFGRKIPQHAFLRKGSKAVYLMSHICGM